MLRFAIAPGGDERGKLAAGDRPSRQAVRLQPDAVPRRLVVERKILAVMTDFGEAAGKLGPLERRRIARGAPARRLIGGKQRIDRKDVLDVHQDQFLMLLLVMAAELDQRCHLGPDIVARRVDQPRRRSIDMAAIRRDVGAGRT